MPRPPIDLANQDLPKQDSRTQPSSGDVLAIQRGLSGKLRVSVIIPAHNVAAYIRQAVESALSQSVRDLEVIVVDDGSTDGTADEIVTIEDPRLHIVRLAQRQGASAARNTGRAYATAPLLAFLDADDAWHPRKLETHLERMEPSPDLDLTFSLSALMDQQGELLAILARGADRRMSFADLLNENHIRNGSAVMVRRAAIEMVGGFDETLRACNDYDCWLRIAALRANNTACIGQVLTYYRRRPGQISEDWRRLRDAYENVLAKLCAENPQLSAASRTQGVRNMYRYFALLANHSGEHRPALRLLATSFRAAPGSFLADLRSWLVLGSIVASAVLGSGVSRRLERLALGARDQILSGGLRPRTLALSPKREATLAPASDIRVQDV